jgi:uncharacterized protein involved in outer membrane biogenesis
VARKEKVFPTDRLHLGNLKKADAKVKLRARQFLLPRVVLDDLNVHMVLEKGRLRVKQFRSAIGGGTLSGRLDVRPLRKGAVVATSLKIENFDLGHMLKKLKITEILEGQLDLDMQLEGRGRSVAALMAGLNGKISVVVGKGRVNNKYIDMLGADLSSALFRLLNPSKGKANYTDLNCFVSRFDIKDGLADSTVLVFDTKRMSVVGDGEVDLKTEELDISMKPLTKKGIGINGVGKISLSVSELAKPFKVSGTLANPTLGMDPSWAVIAIGKAFGGMLLFGPFGLAAVLASGRLGSDEPCMAAIEIAEKGIKGSGGKKRREEWSMMEEPEVDLF